MYICEECGEIENSWCNDCEELAECDCSDQTYTKVKDITYDCNDGEKTVSINIHHCETCGEVSSVERR